MPDAIAQKKFSCPSCGAAAEWNPAKQSLICPFCGTTSPAQVVLNAAGDQVIKEHDLVAAIRGIPDDKRGWQAKMSSVKCQSCQAISVFDPERVGQRCDFCGSAALVPYEEIKEAFSPESLLPIKISETQVRENIRRWYGSRWFAPNKLKRAALSARARRPVPVRARGRGTVRPARGHPRLGCVPLGGLGGVLLAELAAASGASAAHPWSRVGGAVLVRSSDETGTHGPRGIRWRGFAGPPAS